VGKLFGTDGVRGIFGKELTTDLAFRLGVAAGKFLGAGKGKIVIGRDTRESGQVLEDALIDGILTTGTDVLVTGIIPTPAVAFLIRDLNADGGIVISASHNPPEHNGIKFFDKGGSKLPDKLESEIESFVTEKTDYETDTTRGTIEPVDDAAERYVSHGVSTAKDDLSGLTVAIDCGHGAAYMTSPEAFRRLGANVVVINDDFNGLDINVDSGSTNLKAISKLVQDSDADFGIAHDGDADRVLAVDEKGEIIDGDIIMAICANQLKKAGELTNNTVVSTVMANLGFDKAMEALDIKLIKANVGDRYVLEKMKENGATFGGEQSGHIVFLEHNSTGDGLVTAIQLASALKHSGKTLSELAKIMQKYPQILINVPVKNKSGLDMNRNIQTAIQIAEEKLAANGRVLVRPSGTEPLVRVMAEAADKQTAEKIVSDIVEVVKTELS